jgi:opacity protein-like surface antigen
MAARVYAEFSVRWLCRQSFRGLYLLCVLGASSLNTHVAGAQDAKTVGAAPPSQQSPTAPPARLEPAPEINPQTSAISTSPPPRPQPKPKPVPQNPAPLRAVEFFGQSNPWTGTFLEGTVGYAVNGHSYGVLGLNVGSQIQVGSSVFGVSGGIQGLGPDSLGLRTNWTGTVLARIGYAASDRVLPYIAFGPAVTGVERPGLPVATATGWNVMAGFDYRLSQDWSATASLGYFGFPAIVVGGVGPEVNFSHGELRAGFVYRLPAGWWTK